VALAGGSGSGTTSNVVYIDTRAYTSGPSRTVVTKRKRHGSILYVYRTIYVHFEAPAAPGEGHLGGPKGSSHGGNGGGGGLAAQDRIERQRSQQAARIRREQQRLARAARRRAVSLARAQRMRDQRMRLSVARQESRRIAVQQRKAAEERRRIAAISSVEDHRVDEANRRRREDIRTMAKAAVLSASRDRGRTALRAYGILRRHPGSVKGMSLHELATVISDPSSPFDPLRDDDARIVQRWLNAHGHNVAVDGHFGEETNAALADAFESAARHERKRQVAALTRAYYSSGILTAGEKTPDWWPLLGNRVPKPGELLRILHGGGLVASSLFAALTREANQPNLRFLEWRERQVREMGKSLLGVFSDPLSGVFGPMPEHLMQARVAGLPEMDSPMGRSMMEALYRSNTFEQFQHNIKVIERIEEANYARQQLQASHDPAWWQDVLGLINRPVEWFTGWMAGQFAPQNEFNDRMRQFEEQHGRPPTSAERNAIAREIDARFAEARAREGTGFFELSKYEWEQGQADWQAMSPLRRIALEMVYDPLNVVPGVGVIARAGTRGALVLEKAGIRIAASESLIASRLMGSTASFERIIVSHGLMAPAHSARWLAQLQHRTFATLRAGTSFHPALRAISPIFRGVEKATQLKQVAVSNARAGVEFAMRHGFDQIAKVAGREIPETYSNRISKATRSLLDSSKVEVKARIPTVLPGVLRMLKENGVSLYVDAQRREFSTVGARLLARVNAEFRVQALQRIALEAARDAFKAAREEGLTRAEAATREIEEYRRVIREGGYFGKGGGDPRIEDEVSRRVRNLSDTWEFAIIPALHELLEEAAEGAGRTLFDEDTLLWLGRHGDADELTRRLGLHAYDPENLVRVENPRFGVPVPYHVAEELVSAEIRIARYQAIANFARREAAGDAVDAERLGRRLKEIEDDAWSHWDETAEGWVDTRESIEVPSFHARHIQDAYDEALSVKALGDLKPTGSLRDISTMALPPADAFRTGIDNELGSLAWHLGGSHLVEDGDGALDELLRNFRVGGEGRQVVKAFKLAVQNRKAALTAAHDEAIPYALRREWAFWHAMGHAQHRPMRYLYNTLHGAMSAWVFATLPLRPGWVVRNVVDNVTKVFIDGARDPRFYAMGAAKPGAKVASVFQADIRAMREAVRFFDRRFHTNAAAAFDSVIESFFEHSSGVINRIFKAHAMPEVPEKWLNEAKNLPMRRERVPRPFTPHEEVVIGWKDKVWELMAARPENYFKRVRFRSEYAKLIGQGHTTMHAYEEAWKSVERSLFDYSKITVAEDNLRLFFPFIQFWRKNTAFWVRNFANKPWLPAQIALAEDNLRDELHKDWPEWMRRYTHIREIREATADIPGLNWITKHMDEDLMTDPMNFFSFAPLYRAWKGEGIFGEIAEEDRGWAFIAPFVDALNDWGLGLSPWVRKPFEAMGVFNHRAWQTVFPETGFIQAMTRDWLGDRWANRLLNLDAMLGLDFTFNAGEDYQQQFEDWVNLEMLNQAKRGEPVNRARAVETIQDYFLVQNLLGFFAGVYTRRMTPEDFYLYKLADDLRSDRIEWDDLSEQDRALMTFWRNRKGVDSVEFQERLDALPLVESYYRQGSFQEAEKFKRENPGIIPYVEPIFSGRPFSSKFVHTAALVADTDAAMKLFDLVDVLDLDSDTVKMAESFLVTPELRAFWAKNDTPAERRYKMLRGEYYGYLNSLSRKFYALPDDDWEAKEEFLRQHPELARYWQVNNSFTDDYAAILTHVHADLRDRYFEFVEGGDWDAANAFLTAYPFIFDKIDDERYVLDRQTGRGGGGMTQHAADYLKAKAWLDYFFSLPESQKMAWLNGDSEGAKVVRWYFDKYAHDGTAGGQSAHARDYLAAKTWLDYYFSLPEAQRREWLKGGTPGAKVVRDYFKKYGRTNRIARSFQSNPIAASRDADLAQRLRFWARYFSLPADKRPRYVMRQGERHGIFVYGIFGARERFIREQQWLRRAIGAGMSEKQAHYLFVKPLLDFFFTLGKEEKKLFLRANPELQEYLDDFARKTVTGNKKLDRLIEAYFKLPDDSQARSFFLQQHPEVQDYFDSISTPRQRAMHALLEAYFDLPLSAREDFLREHPEIQDYFDRRERERHETADQYRAFDQADPRFRPFLNAGSQTIRGNADRMLAFLRGQKAGRLAGDTLEARTERRPTS
jgi:hypothetical protein